MHEDELLFTEFFNQKLRERGYTLKHLSEETGISIKHLENFSHGRFEHLPSAPYVHGYFVKLAPILGFDADEWWDRVKEEDTVHRAGSADKLPDNRFSGMRFRALIWIGVAVLLGLIYVGARYTTILGEPQLVLSSPAAANTSTTVSDVTFQGSVKNGDILMVNGANVPLDPDGSFSTDVSLNPGQNTITLAVQKTLGRTITLTRTIFYDDTQTIAPASASLTTTTTATTTPSTTAPITPAATKKR